MNYTIIAANIREQLRDYLRDNKLRSVVIGVSGGVDSAVCCALVRPVCDDLGVSLIGRSLPTDSTTDGEFARAEAVGDTLCHSFSILDITKLCDEYLKGYQDYESDEDCLHERIRRGNVKARMRMIHLYDIAKATDGLVLSTDNFSELMCGFFTKNGDVGDFGMIQNLWKTEVYALAKYLCEELRKGKEDAAADALQSTISAEPTDGLGVSKTDLDQLKASSYAEVDKILKTWLTTNVDDFFYDDFLAYSGRLTDYFGDFIKYRDSLKDHPVVRRHEATHFKRAVLVNIHRIDLLRGANNA